MFEPQVRYPKLFPAGEINQIVSYLRGVDGVDLGCAAECAWNVQGFAMSFIPHDHPLPIGSEGECDDEALAVKLEEVCSLYGTVQGPSEMPAWLILLAPVIREVVNRLLDRLNK